MLISLRASNEGLLRAQVPEGVGRLTLLWVSNEHISSCAFCKQEERLPAPSSSFETARCTSTKGSLVDLHSPCFHSLA